MMILKMVIVWIIINAYCFVVGWLDSVASRVVYELGYKKVEKNSIDHVLHVASIQNISVKLPVVPVGDTGTIPHHMRTAFKFPGAPGDRRPCAGDGRMLDVVR
jgi:hypothetical protein